eukprot:CAMPEP_0172443610 /NCGR_PEP_ID=MMETSP1065-20121228/3840_1 /TAXON_ID=265537 /ORGANISM="Amphiprora paludosa, Strain CCMP125" /LENGTH=605 /DNA_ID=CAMNT_0013193901 /DNA_START=792 /DNA_END=2609 /DNA_ORIENTATION=+
MISAIGWVPVGVSDPNPKRYELSAAERDVLQAMEEQEGNINNRDQITNKDKRKRGTIKVQVPPSAPASELPADLRMDEYSDDDEADEGAALGNLLLDQPASIAAEVAAEEAERNDSDSNDNGNDEEDGDDHEDDVPDTREFEPVDVEGLGSMGLYNVGMGTGADMEDMDFDEDDSEAEDVKITDDDAVILVTKTEDDFSALEVHVYDQKRGTLYVHHDIPLPSFPLCLAHGQVSSEGTTGNFCAVGTFDTGIEVWNLDVLNALEPSCILGGEDTSSADEMMKLQMAGGNTKNTKMDMSGMNGASLKPGSHTEAVMSLSWNPIHKQVIASGSADTTVKLWDVTQANDHAKANATTFQHHRGKVQSVVWHPKEGTLLATGGYDRKIALLDARSSGDNAKFVKVQSDCEVLAWDPFHPENLVVGTEDGQISCWDVRKFDTSSPLWTLVANEFGGVTDLSFSPHVPGMLVTCSVDKTVTLWDSYSNGAPIQSGSPTPCGSKDMCAGKLYSVGFYPSTPLLLGCGGSGNILSLWNLEAEEGVKRNFGDRLENIGIKTLDSEEADDTSTPKKEDFEAMMAADRGAEQKSDQNGKKKKKGKKGKKKAHKRGS